MKPVWYLALVLTLLPALQSIAQINWINVDAEYGPLPASIKIFKTTESLNGRPFLAFYVEASLDDRQLGFTVDTTRGRRLTPTQYFTRNKQPLVVVNTTFFNFDKNQNLNVVIRNGKLLAYNQHNIALKGKDTLRYKHPVGSAIGISKSRKADVAWLITDSARKKAFAFQHPPATPMKDSVSKATFRYLVSKSSLVDRSGHKAIRPRKWKMKTAIGGGPVLVQEGKVSISNEEELKFTGKAINDKHPRTSMGYKADGKLIILVIQGRFPGIAEGATLEQQARILVELGCTEAINLDGGGSSCLLVNGKETIKPSDKEGQRAVPAVFLINQQ